MIRNIAAEGGIGPVGDFDIVSGREEEVDDLEKIYKDVELVLKKDVLSSEDLRILFPFYIYSEKEGEDLSGDQERRMYDAFNQLEDKFAQQIVLGISQWNPGDKGLMRILHEDKSLPYDMYSSIDRAFVTKAVHEASVLRIESFLEQANPLDDEFISELRAYKDYFGEFKLKRAAGDGKILEEFVFSLIRNHDIGRAYELILLWSNSRESWKGIIEVEDRDVAMIQEKKLIASQCLLFEDVLVHGDDQDIESFFSQAEKKGLPKVACDAMRGAAASYSQWVDKATGVEDQLQRSFGEMDEVELGALLFNMEKDSGPIGEVRCKRVEGYFIMFFQEPKDFASFSGYKPGEVTGVHIRAKGFRYKEGSREKSLSLHFVGVSGLEDSGSEITVKHERQHALNRFLDLSKMEVLYRNNKWQYLKGITDEKAVESGYKSKNVYKTEIRVKDEYLAFLRGEEPIMDISDVLVKYDLYSDHYTDVSSDEEDRIKKIIVDTSNLLAGQELHMVASDRAFLTYMLLDVPFNRFPSFLRKWCNEQKQRLKAERDMLKKDYNGRVRADRVKKSKRDSQYYEEMYDSGNEDRI